MSGIYLYNCSLRIYLVGCILNSLELPVTDNILQFLKQILYDNLIFLLEKAYLRVIMIL